MPRKKMWVEWEDGAELSQSQKKPGDYSPLTRDGDKKLGHVTLSDADADADDYDYDYEDDSPTHSSSSGPGYVADERAPDISSLVPLALVAITGIAAGVAGVKVAQHLKNRREESRSTHDLPSPSAAPAGWYEMASDSTRLRYWDGTAWTDDFAQRQRTAAAIAADWYPDPSNATQLRYWDGTAWTHHVAPRRGAAATPADWYPDPSNATQLRYWDGAAWTGHVTPRHGAAAVAQPTGTSPDKGLASRHEAPRIRMSSAEWQAHVRAWMAAGAIEQELWRRLSMAHISDADQVTLEAQREMEQLTPEQGAHRIRLMLEADPSLRDEVGLTEFSKFFSAGGSVMGRDQPVSIERTNESRRPRSSR